MHPIWDTCGNVTYVRGYVNKYTVYNLNAGNVLRKEIYYYYLVLFNILIYVIQKSHYINHAHIGK